jgi:hypothetical protein
MTLIIGLKMSLTTDSKTEFVRHIWLFSLTGLYGLVSYLVALHHLQYLESDALFPYAILSDISQKWDALESWITTPNLYIFPDLIMMMAAMAVADDPWRIHLTYYLLVLASIPALLFWNYYALSRDRQHVLHCSLLASLTCLFVLSLGDTGNILRIFIKPGTHGGAIIAGMAATGFLLRAYQGDKRSLIGLFAVGSLGSLSDKVYVTQFVLPGIMFFVCLSITSPRQRNVGIRISSVLMISLFTGQLLFYLLKNHLVSVPPVITAISTSAATRAISRFWSDLQAKPLLLALGCLTVIFIYLGGKKLSSHRRDERLPPHPMLPVLFGIGACTSFVAAILSGLYLDFETNRYLLLLYFSPFLGLSAWLLSLPINHIPLKVASFTLTVTLVFMFGSPQYLTSSSRYPVDLMCLDRAAQDYRLKVGLGDYWSAKYISYLAKSKLEVHQILPQGGRFLWINNRQRYQSDPETNAGYDFIVMNRLDRLAIERQIGTPPDIIKNCDSIELWLFTTPKKKHTLALVK